MCVLRERVGEDGRPLRVGNGGGVNERARGLLNADGDGERAGDDASWKGRQPEAVADVSSSEWMLGSSSLSKEETTKVGSASSRLGLMVLVFLDEVPFGTLADDGPAAAGALVVAELSPCVGSRRVRGRLSFLSGSWAGCSMGEPVTDRAFRLRVLGLEFSASRARSRAPQARLSSRVSSTGGSKG